MHGHDSSSAVTTGLSTETADPGDVKLLRRSNPFIRGLFEL